MWGNYTPVYSGKQALAFKRTAPDGKSFLVVLNLTHRPCYLHLEGQSILGKVVLSASSELEGKAVAEKIQLGGDEGIIVELNH